MNCLIALSHGIVPVIHEVMVKMDVVWPHLLVVSETDLCPVVDVVGNGAVVDRVTVRRVEGAFWMKGVAVISPCYELEKYRS